MSLVPSGDDFISEDVFQKKVQDQNQDALNWTDLPTGVIFKILEVLEVEGKFDKSKILTLKNQEGNTPRVWACPTLNKENSPLQGALIGSTGFKLSKKSNQQYLSYDLVRK